MPAGQAVERRAWALAAEQAARSDVPSPGPRAPGRWSSTRPDHGRVITARDTGVGQETDVAVPADVEGVARGAAQRVTGGRQAA
ncbi:hypothetical protein [Lentzea atacamensis]|uniref:hypothetical protein n=1 Tax=Lentzea atacamensis TaxID=531938 RepID=UPI0014759EBC|nr:hypothetical protein [Lentzea atacamensis]